MKPRNPLLQKQALDETFEMWNDPAYAEHQHHSDPDFTTQNGKDFAGRNTTEPEAGALKDGIPANLLSVELGKHADFLPHDPSTPTVRKPTKSYNPTGDTPTTSDEYRECVNCGQGFDVDPRRKSDMCSKCMREAYPHYYASAVKSADVDNPHVTTIPSAPAPVDPDDAEFFKESDDLSPAEEKITGIIMPEGFHYGARVNDGTTLWFRGNNERVSFNPKTGNVTYSKDGKALLECPVNDLKQHVTQMLKSAARQFHETLKAMLGQTAAIRPSPHKVFEDKIDNSTGQEHPAPKSPSDTDVEQAKQTLENAGVGDQIGLNASKRASKWGDRLVRLKARRDPDGIEELGTKASGFAGGGPFSCMDCVHRTPHSKNAAGEEVDSCKHPTVMGDPELASRKLPDSTIEVDNDDCCRFVRPTEKKEAKTASCHHKKSTCRKCGNVQTCRCSAPKVSSFVDSCSNCDGTFDKDGAVTKSYGTGTPFGGTPNDPSEDVQDEEDEKTSSAKTALVEQHETPKFLPPRDDIRRHLDTTTKDEVMVGVNDQGPQQPRRNQIDPRVNPDGVVASKTADDEDYELDQSNEYYLDEVAAMKNEAKAVFMEDKFMLQDAADQGMTMDELWAAVGEDFVQNYWESSASKTSSIAVDEGIPCPNCKSTKGKLVEDGESDGVSLRECLTCGSFF